MEKLTDNEIIKALECLLDRMRAYECENVSTGKGLITSTLDLINRLEKENTDLFYKLTGVMHFVDKWLDGDELKQDEVNRAIIMREKTLQITEKQQAEIERLESEYPCKVKCGNNCEIWAKSLSDYDNLIGDISAEGIKEFQEQSKTRLINIYEKYRTVANATNGETYKFYQGRAEAIWECINRNDELVKEMTEGGVGNER